MSNKVLITNSQKAVKVPSGLRILIRRACNAVLEYEHFDEKKRWLKLLKIWGLNASEFARYEI